MQRRTNLILAAAAAIALLGLTQPAAATVVSHNGTGECNGSDDVAVTLIAFNGGCADPTFNELGKVFSEVAEHEMEWEFSGQSSYGFTEIIENETGTPWFDYHITFETMIDPFTIENFEVDVPFTIEEMSETFLTEIWIFFDEPLLSGEEFVLAGSIVLEEPFPEVLLIDVRQHPSVPEPGSLALFATGLLALALFARRRRRLAA